MAINAQYAKEMHDQLGYLATWLPTRKVEIGDVGTIRDGIFEKKATLADLGIDVVIQADPQVGDIEYTSSDAVSVDVGAAGNAPVSGGKVDANIKVSFKRADAVLFQASRCKASTISNLAQVIDTILARYQEGKWPSNQVVVTEVITSAAATVLISSAANAHIDLSVTGSIGDDKAKLASADAKFEIGSFSAIATRVVGEKGSTPLFKAGGVKESWLPWRDPEFRTRAAVADNVQFAPLTYIDLVVAPGERAG